MIDEYTGSLLKATENALKEDKLLFDDYLRDWRSTWLLTVPNFIADHLWIEEFSQRVRQRIEPLKAIDGSHSKHKDVYEQVLEQERTLQRAAKDFLQTTNDRWRSKLQTENLLHLNEPLLCKAKDFYVVNVKPNVILTAVHEGSDQLCSMLVDDHSGRSHASLPTADALDHTGSRGLLSADRPFSKSFHRSRYTGSLSPVDRRPHASRLDYITQSYRRVFDHVLMIDYPLIREEFTGIENDLAQASTIITWNIDTGCCCCRLARRRTYVECSCRFH